MHGGAGNGLVDTDASAAGTLRITRRIGLPSGRAVVGALLITVSVIGLFVANRRAAQPPTTTFVVVTTTVPAGSTLGPDDITSMAMELPADVASRSLTNVDDALGGAAIETLRPGQVLLASAVLAPTDAGESDLDRFEVSLALERSRAVDGTLRPGELVDLVATASVGGATCTSVVVDDARVIRSSGGGDELLTSANGSVTITLSIAAPDEVLAAVNAVDDADITIVRATRAQQVRNDGRVCSGDGRQDDP